MCKIAVIPKVNRLNRDNVIKFIGAMTEAMSVNDRDGFGYAAVDTGGDLFAERWLNNSRAFVSRDPLSSEDVEVIKEYKGFVSKEVEYNSEGSINFDMMTSIILHARMATSGKQFFNTHPFVIGDHALIHNGVISQHKGMTNEISTCDSECILQEHIKNDVSNHPKNIQQVANKLDGYYACAVYSRSKEHGMILDVFKDNTAQLTAFIIKEIGMIFATSITNVIDAAKKCGFSIERSYKVEPGKMIRFDAITGDVIGCFKFQPFFKGKAKKKDNYESYFESKSTELISARLVNDVHSDWERDGSGGWIKKSHGY